MVAARFPCTHCCAFGRPLRTWPRGDRIRPEAAGARRAGPGKGIWSGRSTRSLLANYPLWPAMLHALAHTSVLLAAALLVVVLGSVALAVVAARRPGSPVDLLLRAASYLAWGIPAFLLALVVQLVLSDVGSSRGW